MQTGRVQQRENNFMSRDKNNQKEEKRAMTSDNKRRKPFSPPKKPKTKRFFKIDEVPIHLKEQIQATNKMRI